MTDADAEWLRERPHIRDHYEGEYGCASDGLRGLECGWAAFVEVLPTLRAAIRADVVRELAGGATRDQLAEVGLTWADDLERGISDREGFAGDFARRILEERAAAHAQGRAAGREECVEIAQDYATEDEDGTNQNDAFKIVTAIRSLP